MSKIKIKICGIKNLAILNCCNELNINYCGLIFYNKSPRNIDILKASNLIKFQKQKITIPIGVFVNYDLNDLNQLIKKTKLKYIQLHGNENNSYISKLKKNNNIKVIKAIGIEKENDLKQLNEFSEADFFLIDYKGKVNELPGGNAKSFNWSILKGKEIVKPWFISGGINKNNINNLLENLIPYGIDISSGVEDQPGIKNINKIKEIVKIING